MFKSSVKQIKASYIQPGNIKYPCPQTHKTKMLNKVDFKVPSNFKMLCLYKMFKNSF